MSFKDYLMKQLGISEERFDELRNLLVKLRTAEFLFVKGWAIQGCLDCLNCLYHMGERMGKGE